MSSWPIPWNGQDFASSAMASSDMVSVTPAQNSKGSVSQLVAATSFDAVGVIVNVQVGTGGVDSLWDLMIGDSGSEAVLVPDLLVSSPSGSSTRLATFFPLQIPAGTRLSARAAASGAAVIGKAGVTIVGGPQQPTCQEVTAYGVTLASSGGTTVDPGASVNSKGVWAQIVASTSAHHRLAMIGIGNQANLGRATGAFALDIGIGGSGSEQVLIPDLGLVSAAGDDLMKPATFGPFPCTIPAGTRLSARASSSINDATDRLFDVVFYGVS